MKPSRSWANKLPSIFYRGVVDAQKFDVHSRPFLSLENLYGFQLALIKSYCGNYCALHGGNNILWVQSLYLLSRFEESFGIGRW